MASLLSGTPIIFWIFLQLLTIVFIFVSFSSHTSLSLSFSCSFFMRLSKFSPTLSPRCITIVAQLQHPAIPLCHHCHFCYCFLFCLWLLGFSSGCIVFLHYAFCFFLLFLLLSFFLSFPFSTSSFFLPLSLSCVLIDMPVYHVSRHKLVPNAHRSTYWYLKPWLLGRTQCMRLSPWRLGIVNAHSLISILKRLSLRLFLFCQVAKE